MTNSAALVDKKIGQQENSSDMCGFGPRPEPEAAQSELFHSYLRIGNHAGIDAKDIKKAFPLFPPTYFLQETIAVAST